MEINGKIKNALLATVAGATIIGLSGSAVESLENTERQNTEYVEAFLASAAISESVRVVFEESASDTSELVDIGSGMLEEPAVALHRAERGEAIQLEPPPPPPEPEIDPTVFIPNFYNWLPLSECESGSNWTINTGNGYYGGLQFSLSSWRAAGGAQYAQRPDLASPFEQMVTAEVLLGMQGWGAWPACTRKLGIR